MSGGQGAADLSGIMGGPGNAMDGAMSDQTNSNQGSQYNSQADSGPPEPGYGVKAYVPHELQS